MTTTHRKSVALALGLAITSLVGCSSSDGTIEDFCKADGAINMDELNNIDTTNGDAISASLAKITEGARAITPPAEIKDDWNTVIDAFEAAAESLKGLDLSNPDDLTTLTDMSEKMSSAEFAEAIDNVTAFEKENCSS